MLFPPISYSIRKLENSSVVTTTIAKLLESKNSEEVQLTPSLHSIISVYSYIKPCNLSCFSISISTIFSAITTYPPKSTSLSLSAP